MKTLAFFTVFDGIMWGRKSQRKDICTLSALSGASGLYAEVFGEAEQAGVFIMAGSPIRRMTSLLPLIDLPSSQRSTWDFWQGPGLRAAWPSALPTFCAGGTDAAMVTLAAAYLAVTLLVQEARFVKRFYVRRLTNNGAINFNGYTITLADGTVLR